MFVCLFVIGSLSVSVSAEEKDLPGDDIFAIAADVFPEYASRIMNPTPPASVYSRTVDSGNEVAIMETRNVSDTEQITYLEYADGTYSLAFTATTYLNSSSSGSGYRFRSIDIQVNHSYIPGAMYIRNLTYTLVTGGYDQINSTGTTSGSTIGTSLSYYNSTESSSSPARAVYTGDFPYPETSPMNGWVIRCNLYVEVGDDQCIITPYSENLNSVG